MSRLIWTFLIGVTLSMTSSLQAETVDVSLRKRVATHDEAGNYRVEFEKQAWDASETAVIVCDMWDAHHCLNAVRRETEMAPRLNEFLNAMRSKGALIVHAPSSCIGPYETHPARAKAKEAPMAANLPKEIASWCYKIPSEEQGVYPIDQTDGGEDDDLAEHTAWHAQLAAQGRNPKAPWLKQIDVIDIHDVDAISDSGVEIWNLLEQTKVKNVMLLGVHTNMCVLGRPFGLRRMAENGKNVVLVRDLTDTMYNPQRAPFVSHFSGTDLIVEHIEKFVCPTITSNQVLGGQEFRYSGDKRPHVVFVISEPEYRTNESLTKFAREHLQANYRVSFVLPFEKNGSRLSGFEMINDADVLFLSMHRKALPQAELELIQKKIRSGTAVVGIRTASHSFTLRENAASPEGHSQWPEFDNEVLGGSYHGHHGNQGEAAPVTTVWVDEGAKSHPLVDGLSIGEVNVKSWLYKTEPLLPGTTILMMGKVGDRMPLEPVTWTNINRYGGRVFYTSLGHIEDFGDKESWFQQLLKRGVDWAASQ